MPLKTASHISQLDGQRITGINYSQLRALCRISGRRDGVISQSSEEAHEEFMNSYQKIFLRPKKIMPAIPLGKIRTPPSLKAVESQASQERSRSQSQGKQTQEILISHAIKALKKIPIERIQQDLQAIHKVLKIFPCFTTQLSEEVLHKISSIAIVETWERGQIIYGHNGFYLILKGFVKPYTYEDSKEDQKMVAEMLVQDYAMKRSLIQGCQFYLDWPKVSIDHLAKLIQLRTFPVNQVLVKEGRVCPFVAYICEGECSILQDIGSLINPAKKKGGGIKSVVVGRLGPMESFGEISVLQDQPSPCTIVTATELEAGIIQPETLQGIDPVTISLMLQTAQPMCGKLSQEEKYKEYKRQEKSKEWDHIKKQVLSDALFYNGIRQGCGKWTLNRGPGKTTDK
ncbi:cyclic nucleotide-binding domain-containing protein 1 isoform X3 [Hoplias malabaricus]|uniref:cyclic nucleotide-binding domain-containing protein 1 isoform X3 n=1 Tax=Hoplias malabaricus TaxID=27720 RepID=UPI003462E94D